MADRHLHTHPKSLGDEAWWYELPEGLVIVVQHRTREGDYIDTKQYRIPWSMIEGSVERRNKPDEPKKRRAARVR